MVDEGVGEEGHVGGELAPEPAGEQRRVSPEPPTEDRSPHVIPRPKLDSSYGKDQHKLETGLLCQ